MSAKIRKMTTLLERIYIEGGKEVPEGETIKVAVGAVVTNPFAGKYVENLEELFDIGEAVADAATAEALRVLDGRPVESFGKAAIVGLDGELEHAAAILHSKMGLVMRRYIGGGKAMVPSTAKRASAGTLIDVPIHYKDTAILMSHFDTIEFQMPDAPRPDEILVVVAYGTGSRPHPRSGGLKKDEIQGYDRYAFAGGMVFTERDEDGLAISSV